MRSRSLCSLSLLTFLASLIVIPARAAPDNTLSAKASGDIYRGESLLKSGTDGEGVVRLTDWPRQPESELTTYDILPYIETMALSYRYGIGAEAPILNLTLEWTSAGRAVYDGRVIPIEEVPADVRMVAFEIAATARSSSGLTAPLIVVVDSMALGASPDYVQIDLADLTWETIFEETSADEARAIFGSGFELHDLEIRSVAFAAFSDEHVVAEERVEPGEADGRGGIANRPEPTRVAVYHRDRSFGVFFDLHWLIARRHVHAPAQGGRSTARGEMGRGRLDDDGRRSRARSRGDGVRDSGGDDEGGSRTTERSGSREGGRSTPLPVKRSKGDSDDDDDDENVLVPAAIAAVAAAGILAFAGGAIGYYGHPERAPLGLTSGLVRKDGGLLLQVGVNEELISGADGPKRLLVKVLSYGNLFRSSIQPALAAGVLATARGSDVAYEPSISLGGVGTFGAFLVYGGYDFSQAGPEVSVALNFRYLRQLWSRENSGEAGGR